MLHSNATDDTAQLTLYIQGPAVIAVRLVSLFPAENVEGDVLQPFRPDLLQYLKDLQPRSDTFPQFFFPFLFLYLSYKCDTSPTNVKSPAVV